MIHCGEHRIAYRFHSVDKLNLFAIARSLPCVSLKDFHLLLQTFRFIVGFQGYRICVGMKCNTICLHLLKKINRVRTKHSRVFGVTLVPCNWQVISIDNDLVEDTKVIVGHDDGENFKSLTDTKNRPILFSRVLHVLGVTVDFFSRYVVWVLFTSLWIDEVKTASGEKYTVDLRQQFNKVIFGDVVRNGHSS